MIDDPKAISWMFLRNDQLYLQWNTKPIGCQIQIFVNSLVIPDWVNIVGATHSFTTNQAIGTGKAYRYFVAGDVGHPSGIINGLFLFIFKINLN